MSSKLDSLRTPAVFPTLRLAIQLAALREPHHFRIVHFSVQPAHVHLLVEADNARWLSSGVRSVSIRIARYVNELLERTGKLWDDRYRCRVLPSAREVRSALVFVLASFRQDGGKTRAGIDPYSSGAWFDGWRSWQPTSGTAPPFAERVVFGAPHPLALRAAERAEAAAETADTKGTPVAAGPPVLAPRTSLLRSGWRRYGLLELDEAPLKPPVA